MTKKKTRYKSALLNFFITVFCLALCGASLWLFYKDLTSSSLRSDKDAVATITFKYKIAQRKYNDRVVWERLAQNSPLYNGDTIHTADMAQATINFANGAGIEIDENSMVQIAVNEDGSLKVSVSGGTVCADTTNSTESITLDMGGTVLNMQKGSKISAALDESKSGAAFQVLAGGAVIGDANGNLVASVGAGESVKVSKDGSVAKSPITVTSVSVNQKILLFDNQRGTVPLEWFPIQGAENFIVETSTKKDFSVIKNRFTVKDKNKVELPASDGMLYWRIYIEGDVQNAAQGKLNFAEIPPLQARQSQDVFSYYGENPCVNLSWSGNEFAQKYKVEVSKSADFSNIEFQKETASQSIAIKDLPDGKYYWRVTPYYEINNIGYYGTTSPKTFSVERLAEMLPPELTFPPDQNKVAYTDAEFPIDFAWKAQGAESEYTLRIARDRNFESVVLTESTSAKSLRQTLSVYEFPAGEYYWNVSQTVGGKNYVSDARRFIVEKYKPEQNRLLFPDDSYSVEADKLNTISFMWKISKENQEEFASQKTVLQFSKTENFSSIDLAKVTDDISIKNIKLEPGKYYWRVVKGSSQSNTRSIYVLGELALPQILTPELEQKFIFAQAKESPVSIRWKKTPGADFYKLKILDGETNSVVKDFGTLTQESASFVVSPTQKERKFVAQVQAFTNETKLSGLRKSQIAQSDFIVKIASPVRLVTPAAKARLDGLAALKDGVTLNWTKGDDAYSSAELLLWRVGIGGRLTLVKTYKNPRETLNVGRLSSGNYRWTVRASTKQGIALNATETRDFSVLAVPDLPAPVLNEPRKNQNIGADYLTKNRTITFSWRAVKGATEYDFVLYQKTASGGLKKIHSVQATKNTQVKIRDLKIFDIGAFQWQVTARNKAKDGFVLQKGKTAVQDFTIDFELPGKVDALDPGEIYGE